jgi:glycosyltransferase involved in cell wall biosynthesis
VEGAAATGARPRVLIVSHDYAEAGLRRQVDAFARLLDVRFVTPRRAEVLVFPDHLTAADRHTRTYRRLSLFGHQYLMLSPSLGLREHRPELIYATYDPWSAVFWQVVAAAAALAPRARIVSGVKKNTYRRYPGARGRAKDAVADAGMGRVDHFIAASEMTARLYERVHGVAATDISVAPRVGVDTGVFAPRERGVRREAPLVAGYCGRLSEHKGVLDLVDAVAAARAAGAGVELELLGAGELRETLAARARATSWLRVSDAVPSDEVAEFMRGLDLYVLPARVLPDHEEHDAHALLQALSCGLPAIGTVSGIIPEILDDPDDVLVGPGDPDALAAAIAGLAGDPDRRERLAARGRHAAAERYSLERVAARYAEIFSGLLADRRPDRPGPAGRPGSA